MKRRDANLILIALAAFGGGVIACVLPLSLFETISSATGLPERFPAFAPPLGTTARQLLIGAGAVMCAAATALLLPWRARQGRSRANGKERGMSFIFSRLMSLARGWKAGAGTGAEPSSEVAFPEVPVLRRSDSHPDAPARAPVSARRDLGKEALPAVDAPAASGAAPATGDAEAAQGEVAHAPDPLPWSLIEQEMNRILNGGHPRTEQEIPPVEALAAAFAPVVGPESGGADTLPEEGASVEPREALPTIQELLERLERGFERRRARARIAPDAEDSPE